MLCYLVQVYQHFWVCCYLCVQGRWYSPSMETATCTRLCGVTHHKMAVFTGTALRTWSLPQFNRTWNTITIDRSISWKEQISELTSKLNKACYAIRAIKPLLSLHVLLSIYFAYFHSVMTYGIIFWGNSHLSSNIFKIQKRALRIMTNKSKRETCRPRIISYLTIPIHILITHTCC